MSTQEYTRPSTVKTWIRHVRRYFRRWFQPRPSKHRDAVFNELHEHIHAGCEGRCSGAGSGTSRDQCDVYLIEMKMIRRMSPMELAAKIEALRYNLREMLVADEYNELIKRLSDEAAKQNGAAAEKWEALALLDRVYRRYTLVPNVERRRSRITRRLIILMFWILIPLATIVLIYSLVNDAWLGPISVAYVSAAMAGSVGATVSTIIRLYKVDPRRDPLMLWLSLERGAYSLLLAPFLGALFGLMFLMLMRSGVIDGSLFPDFNNEQWRTGGMALDSGRCRGSLGCDEMFKDFEGLLVWSFAAGWMERLVPDVLNRMSHHARSQADARMDG